ncbi:hypothetical protein P4V43_22885 [Brevibacillus fortis]|uniref:BC1872 family protein n=1 Tax=Brevibacillus fortis TaxID=2126352 RepID=UPI002E244783|nr:hypothetical protein [Brevibacillus fortis]
MTEQQMVLTLATKVMEWETRSEQSHFWLDSDGHLRPKSNWNPLHNIADAWQVVEKFESYMVWDIEGKHHARLYYETTNWFYGYGDTVQEAICNAGVSAAEQLLTQR